MKAFKFLFVAVMTAVFCCCTKPKDVNEALNRISDDLSGDYVLENIARLDHERMDLDGDGSGELEMIHEFYRLPETISALRTLVHIEKAYSYDIERYFTVSIPVQYLNYDAVSKTYSFVNPNAKGGTCELLLYYKVNSDGGVSTGSETGLPTTGLDVEYGKKGVDILNTQFVDFTSFGSGYLDFIINASYYDFAKREYAKVPVRFTYRKVN